MDASFPPALQLGQATCSCQPGLVSANHNASAGCFAYCFPHSCDKSATCQVTPEGRTRWAQEWSREGGVGSTYTQVQGPRRPGEAPVLTLTYPPRAPRCQCKAGEVGDGRACYGHLLHEVQKANEMGTLFQRLKVTVTMLGECPLGLPLTRAGEGGPQSAEILFSLAESSEAKNELSQGIHESGSWNPAPRPPLPL